MSSELPTKTSRHTSFCVRIVRGKMCQDLSCHYGPHFLTAPCGRPPILITCSCASRDREKSSENFRPPICVLAGGPSCGPSCGTNFPLHKISNCGALKFSGQYVAGVVEHILMAGASWPCKSEIADVHRSIPSSQRLGTGTTSLPWMSAYCEVG